MSVQAKRMRRYTEGKNRRRPMYVAGAASNPTQRLLYPRAVLQWVLLDDPRVPEVGDCPYHGKKPEEDFPRRL